MRPRWRKDELSLKVFYNLSQQEKEKYLELLEGMDPEYWGDTDIHILNFHSKQINKPKKFLNIEETL
jgi:hypothetical protein